MVLVVDDEPANLELLARLLKSDYDVRLARSGEKALSLARSNPPDLVILDVEMSGLDGYGVCAVLAGDPVLRDVPVIFLTGRSSVEDEARGFALGAVDYVHKPLSPPLLLARVKTHLALRAAIGVARREKQNADRLLEVVLPRAAADELRLTQRVAARRIDNMAVLFVDLCQFTSWSESLAPEEIVPTLHQMFLEFEGITKAHGLEKLKTVGHGYMAGAGLLGPTENPLYDAVRAGLDMATAVSQVVAGWQVRVGVNAGPVVAGIVGGERFQFDVWGDTVNVAARLASVGKPGVVTIPASLQPLLEGKLSVRRAGFRALKGKGDVEVAEATAD